MGEGQSKLTNEKIQKIQDIVGNTNIENNQNSKQNRKNFTFFLKTKDIVNNDLNENIINNQCSSNLGLISYISTLDYKNQTSEKNNDFLDNLITDFSFNTCRSTFNKDNNTLTTPISSDCLYSGNCGLNIPTVQGNNLSGNLNIIYNDYPNNYYDVSLSLDLNVKPCFGDCPTLYGDCTTDRICKTTSDTIDTMGFYQELVSGVDGDCKSIPCRKSCNALNMNLFDNITKCSDYTKTTDNKGYCISTFNNSDFCKSPKNNENFDNIKEFNDIKYLDLDLNKEIFDLTDSTIYKGILVTAVLSIFVYYILKKI
jgi:hypothetical protein